MSCSGNQSDATAAFPGTSFSSGVSPIQAYAQAVLTNNAATLSVTKGVVTSNLTFSNSLFPTICNGTGEFYLKVDPETDGSNSSPPVTADSKYYSVQSVTLNANFTSSTYGDVTPIFDGSQTCGSTTTWGWIMNDAQVVMTRTKILTAQVLFS